MIGRGAHQTRRTGRTAAIAGAALVLVLTSGPAVATEPSKLVGKAADPAARFLASFQQVCSASCQKRSRARAAAWAMVKADCERSCDQEWALPLLLTDSDLSRHAGARVRVIGRLGGAGTSSAARTLRLAGGRSIALELEDRAQWSGLAPGAEVIAAGLVRKSTERDRTLKLTASTVAPLNAPRAAR